MVLKKDTHSLAPGQPGGVMLLDVVLHLGPDGDVGFDPIHVHLISADETKVQDAENADPRGREDHSLLLVVLQHAVGVEHGGVLHLFDIRTRLRRLHGEESRERIVRGRSSDRLYLNGLTMATHPSAGTLSLTADRWLKSGEVRFCSRNAWTCWMALETGCIREVRTVCREDGSLTHEANFWTSRSS